MREINELYSLYSKELFTYLLYLTNDYSLAEDLVQETFYQAFISIHRFQGKSKVKTWLYQIAKHVYYKQLKKNTKKEEFDEHEGMASILETPETILQKKEEVGYLYRSIMDLKEPHKQVLILRIYNELSFKDIGEIFSKSENWSRVTFHRGKQMIQKKLKKVEY